MKVNGDSFEEYFQKQKPSICHNPNFGLMTKIGATEQKNMNMLGELAKEAFLGFLEWGTKVYYRQEGEDILPSSKCVNVMSPKQMYDPKLVPFSPTTCII